MISTYAPPQNYSYHYNDDSTQNTFAREVFSRDTQRDMGQPYARSRYYHLYLNGLYWGLYQSQEHTEASYGSRYFGGDEEDYDAVKCVGGFARGVDDENPEGLRVKATDGNLDGWKMLYETANEIAQMEDVEHRQALYQKLLGRDAHGQRLDDQPVYLDPENLIDYMLVIFFTGNFDAPVSQFIGNRGPNNWFSMWQT